jgi:hypothetical protein|tara:strand:- start:299 stop:559 length:261 start_codon:yes stop_codon:yes gene_type:complete
MEPQEIVDLVGSEAPSSEVSDAIKQALFAKSVEKVDALTPDVASVLFGGRPEEQEVEDEAPEAEAETEIDASIDQDQEETEQEPEE